MGSFKKKKKKTFSIIREHYHGIKIDLKIKQHASVFYFS